MRNLLQCYHSLGQKRLLPFDLSTSSREISQILFHQVLLGAHTKELDVLGPLEGPDVKVEQPLVLFRHDGKKLVVVVM